MSCGADTPSRMAQCALAHADARAIKLKLTGEPIDAERVRAVRRARPDVMLTVDANQGFTRTTLEALLPILVEADVALIEQPVPIGQDDTLAGLGSPIPLVADESVLVAADIMRIAPFYDVINLKLDKCGGLTEAFAARSEAKAHGLETYVGNMFGTSLAMAPAYLLAQQCDFVELDAPLFLTSDRSESVRYDGGKISCSANIWGVTRRCPA